MLQKEKKEAIYPYLRTEWDLVPGGVLNFELGTNVRPEVSTTTL